LNLISAAGDAAAVKYKLNKTQQWRKQQSGIESNWKLFHQVAGMHLRHLPHQLRTYTKFYNQYSTLQNYYTKAYFALVCKPKTVMVMHFKPEL
jgi:hypothetical protein